MAAAKKSDHADTKKKSKMPRLFLGLWLVALTVLLALLFMNMPEKSGRTADRPLIKKISVPAPDELNALMERKADKQSVDRVAGHVAGISQKVDKNHGNLAVLDQRVDRLETTVSDKLRLPSESFPEIAPPPPEERPDTETPPSEKKTDQTAGQTPGQATDPSSAETAAGQPDALAVVKPVEIGNLPAPPQPAASPATAVQTPAAEGLPGTPEPGGAASVSTGESPAVTAAPSPGRAPRVRAERPSDRQAVRQKIAEREAYIRRTAARRRAAGQAAAPAAGVRSPYPTRRSMAGAAGRPAGSLHRFSRRFDYRVDLSRSYSGGSGDKSTGSDIIDTAPGMTIFSDRGLRMPKID